ncbi:MAG: hypothetical protein HQL69_15560 [Magnetococcales bacterium]|nr:hypothetical protein [Magnetococcales bacterium]
MGLARNGSTLSDMEDVVADMVAEHEECSLLLRSALSHGIRTQNGKSFFKQAKDKLISHHENELNNIYKPLQEARKAEQQFSKKRYNRYADEISFGFIHTIEMLNDFEKSLDDDIASETNFLKLIRNISERIDFEENVLFLMYLNLASD